MEEKLCGHERGIAADDCTVEFPTETTDIRAQPHLSNCTGKCSSMKQTVSYRLLKTASPKIIFHCQMPDNKHTICGVHLPNSEDFAGNDEVMISVALGFVAHLVQMISIFLQVPLRYPIIHFGSRTKIVDHIAEKIPDKDRE